MLGLSHETASALPGKPTTLPPALLCCSVDTCLTCLIRVCQVQSLHCLPVPAPRAHHCQPLSCNAGHQGQVAWIILWVAVCIRHLQGDLGCCMACCCHALCWAH